MGSTIRFRTPTTTPPTPEEAHDMSHPELNRGDTGDDVRRLQERLVEHLQNEGIRLSAVDGDFGPITEESVRYFQQQRGLTADGIVGDATWDLLDASPGSSPSTPSNPGVPTTLRMRPLDLTVPFRLQMDWNEITLDQLNLQLSNFDLRSQPNTQLNFLQPVGRLFGNGGIEVLNLEVRTWPNWFLTWSTQATLDWSQQRGIELGLDNEAEIGLRPLRGLTIKAQGNLDLRWAPMDGTGSVEPSGSLIIGLDILELIR